MEHYKYSELADPNVDVRLLRLLPGEFDDDLSATLLHVPLRKVECAPQARVSLKDLRQTLPPGWKVGETLEGDYLFMNPSIQTTSWQHPNPDISPDSYETQKLSEQFQPNYEALSYTWGTDQSQRIVRIVSEETVSSLQIQHNLDIALRYLRSLHESRVLWVDAVCINQKNISERDRQVTRMGDIYRYASKVIAWVGPESATSGLALSTLDDIGRQVTCLTDGYRFPTPGCAHPTWFKTRAEIPYREDAWEAIMHLAERPWFERLWVTQEIQLASPGSILQCGKDNILWCYFRNATSCLYVKSQPSMKVLHTRIEKIYRFTWPLRNKKFLDLINTTYERICVDPRDKIYGLLGLASPRLLSSVRPNYTFPVAAVYQDAFFAMLEETQSLDALGYCVLGDTTVHGLPSWVPDWSLPLKSRPGGMSQAHLAVEISGLQPVLHVPNTLEVSGLKLTTVNSVSRPVLNVKPEGGLVPLKSWAPGDLQTGNYPTGESILDAFSLALVGSYVAEIVPGTSLSLQQLKDRIAGHLSSLHDEHEGAISILSPNRLGALRNRVFITTEDGFFGFGPRETQPGIVTPFLKNNDQGAYN